MAEECSASRTECTDSTNRNEKTELEGKTSSWGLGIRHLQVIVMALATFVAYSLRYNLSIAIVAMVQVPGANSTEPLLAETFDWDGKVQGYILSAFFWGYVITQLPAGVLTQRYGGHRFLCAAVLGTSVLSFLTPQSAYYGGWLLVCFNRMFQGIFQGFIYPSVFTLLGVWAPSSERSKLASTAVSAQVLGTVVSTPLTGFVCTSYGWPIVFYSFGAAGCVVSVFISIFGADTPAKHRMISVGERKYIQSSLGEVKEKLPVPWKSACASAPVISAVVCLSLNTIVYVTFLTKIPTYMATVLKFSMDSNGLLSALPHLVCWILSYVFAWTSDFLTGRGWLKVSAARKVFNSIAFFGSAVASVLLCYTEDSTMSVVLLVAFMGLHAGIYVGVMSSFIDLAPNFSGPLYSIASFIAAGLSITSPIIVGFIVTEAGNADQWKIVFYLSAAALCVGNIVYLMFGSSDTQKWNWSNDSGANNSNGRKHSQPRLSLVPGAV